MASNQSFPSQPGQPQPQRPGQQRQRAKTGFSFRSNHSQKSSGSNHKIEETHQEKEQKRLHSKADPTMALNEAEPSAVASHIKSSLAPIRAIQHRDAQGNPIADPDRSNPTRSRWERPLDTIRSFEAAIDASESGDTNSNYDRRSSYYGGTQAAQNDRPRYGGRPQSYRPESQYGGGMNRPESYYTSDNYAAGPSNGYYPNRARYPRTASEPHFNNGGVYPGPANQQSYETVTTASGGSMEPAGYTTDPSSENSSVDRFAAIPAAPKEPVETYGFNGFGNTPQFVPPGNGINTQYANNSVPRQMQHQTPPPPSKDTTTTGPIKLGVTSGNAGVPSAKAEKRKSWFSKRFSKSS
ncbi:hypothetical protein HYALB_00005550 [Hymenoscyphus albidus]|uniref:DUF2406 domain-containing protein n=1 Tax=Hymenoscyphus albidus TaxID=595503 RepID=A0A9N9Q8I5_9HELO|nr:hypothetical protein HYALB_00005550 [Hymenoscyphus albidus]